MRTWTGTMMSALLAIAASWQEMLLAQSSTPSDTVLPAMKVPTPPEPMRPPKELPPVGGVSSQSASGGRVGDTGAAASRAQEPVILDDRCATCASMCGVPSRWTVRADFGDGVGYTRGFTYLEGFVPFHQPDPTSVWFGDGRVVNFQDADRWEFNAGAGYRKHVERSDAVLGTNLFYDGRHTDTHFFHQIGIGGEALFSRWECRCNGYIIVGPGHKLAGQGQVAMLIGNQLIIDQFQTREVAMGGLDVEVGCLLPVMPKLSPRVFASFYHYSAEQMQSVNGVRGRLEAWLTPRVSMHCAIQNDAVFDTTVGGGLAIHFGGSRVRRDGGPRTVEERLGQRVVRDVDIVVAQRVDRERTVFVDDVVTIPPIVVGVGDAYQPSADPPPDTDKSPAPPAPPPASGPPPPSSVVCLPFPGAPGDPATFPGRHFPPGFHHLCFPGRGRYKHLFGD